VEGLSFDDWGFQSCLDFGLVDGFFLVVEIMVGGYHLIMSVISFIAFQRAVLGGVRYGKPFLPRAVDCVSCLLHRTRPWTHRNPFLSCTTQSMSHRGGLSELRDSGGYSFA
jgi:hypothetical protein